ncbi:hypothetical protein E2542_SST22329 [Spatholobus suberectus]|nr:hypothetical protein E2542_SST22329 [Spatholobus suberectus]
MRPLTNGSEAQKTRQRGFFLTFLERSQIRKKGKRVRARGRRGHTVVVLACGGGALSTRRRWGLQSDAVAVCASGYGFCATVLGFTRRCGFNETAVGDRRRRRNAAGKKDEASPCTAMVILWRRATSWVSWLLAFAGLPFLSCSSCAFYVIISN